MWATINIVLQSWMTRNALANIFKKLIFHMIHQIWFSPEVLTIMKGISNQVTSHFIYSPRILATWKGHASALGEKDLTMVLCLVIMVFYNFFFIITDLWIRKKNNGSFFLNSLNLSISPFFYQSHDFQGQGHSDARSNQWVFFKLKLKNLCDIPKWQLNSFLTTKRLKFK